MKKRYDYNVYGLIRGNSKNVQQYVADTPSEQPVVRDNLSRLADAVQDEHCGHYDPKRDDNFVRPEFFSVSFDPICEKVIYQDKVYRTQRMSEREQERFLLHMRQRLKWLNF